MKLSNFTNWLCVGALITILLSSCAVTEELWIEKDGSGKYQMEMDMGQMLPMIAMMDTTGAMDGMEVTDTTIKFSALGSADSFDISKLDKPELLDRVSVHINMDPESSEMKMSLITDFDYLDQITEIFKQVALIENLKKEKDDSPTSMDNILGMADEEGVGFSWSKGTLTRKEQIIDEEDMKELGAPDMEPEEKAMMKSMFGSMEYKTIIHLPGKIKEVSDPNAKIEGKNTVVFTYDLFEMMEKGKYGAFEIKYK